MVAAAFGAQAMRGRCHEQRRKQEREERQQQRHTHTSILMTLRIHTNPMVCMTMATRIIICPMLSFEQQLHVLGVRST